MTTITTSNPSVRASYIVSGNSPTTFPSWITGDWIVGELRANVGNSFRTSVREDIRFDYKARIKLGLDATTNVEHHSEEVTCSDDDRYGYVLRSKSSGAFSWTARRGRLVTKPIMSTLVDKAMDAQRKCETEFLNKCNEKLTAFQGATFLGELGETLRMIRNPAKQVFTSLFHHHGIVKRRLRGVRGGIYRAGKFEGNPSASKTAKRIISESWLQLQFGIKPLVSDIDTGVQALADFQYRSFLHRVAVSHTVRLAQKQTTLFNGASELQCGAMRISALGINERVDQVTYRGAVMLNLDDKLGPPLQQYFGLNWKSAVLAGWEIIPYSFLADYFVNVGDVLNAATFPISRLAWANRTNRYSQLWRSEIDPSSFRWTAALPTYEVAYQQLPIGAFAQTLSTHIVRTRLVPSSLRGRLILQVPGDTSLKWLNIAALAALRFK